jgi:hypothetical protein
LNLSSDRILNELKRLVCGVSHHLNLAPRLRVNRFIAQLLLYVLMARTGTSLLFTLTGDFFLGVMGAGF